MRRTKDDPAGGYSQVTESSYTIKPEFISDRARNLPASGIRRFFELIANMDGVISLGVGEPDFVTPERFTKPPSTPSARGETHYTSNYGLPELREAIADHLERLYGVRYDPRNEIIITIGVSEGLLLATARPPRPRRRAALARPLLRRLPAVLPARRRHVRARAHEHGERVPGERRRTMEAAPDGPHARRSSSAIRPTPPAPR